MTAQAVLHYHKCRCCDKDCICATEDCAFRATDQEREYVCYLCVSNGQAFLDQLVAGLAVLRLREHIDQTNSRNRFAPIALLGLFFALLFLSPSARADSVSVITQELRHDSSLTLRNDVAEDLAENLLTAQAAAYYTAFEPDSLQLSINAVLRAITLEKSFGFSYCDDSTCPIVWAQSTIAIDTRAGVGLSPSEINFGSVPVSTPEPSLLALLGVPLFVLFLKARKP
jgi:hypothetical protein